MLCVLIGGSGTSGFPSLNEIRRYGTLLNQYSTHDGEFRSVPGVYSNCSMGSGRITKITFIALPGVGGESTVLHFNRETPPGGTRTISLSGATQSFGGGFGYELDLSAPNASMPFNSGDSLWIRHPYHDDSSLRLLHQVGYDEHNICWRELDEDHILSCGIDYDYPLLASETGVYIYNMPEMVNHLIFMHAGFSMHLVEDLCQLRVICIALVPGLPRYVRVLICGGGDNAVKTGKAWAD